MALDHYAVLGVHPDADQAAVRAAYLAVMRATHPDRRPGDDDAAERARLANAAWHVLGDPIRRAAYNRTLQGHGVARRPSTAEWPRTRADAAEPFRQAFHLATLRAGAAIVALGLVLLLALGGG